MKKPDSEFEKAWKAMEARGYSYGADALENVRLGWDMARDHFTAFEYPTPETGEARMLRVKHEAEARVRARFQETYGSFWKCDACGGWIGPRPGLETEPKFPGYVCAYCGSTRNRAAGYAAPPRAAPMTYEATFTAIERTLQDPIVQVPATLVIDSMNHDPECDLNEGGSPPCPAMKVGDRVYRASADLFGRVEKVENLAWGQRGQVLVKWEWPWDPQAEPSWVPVSELVPAALAPRGD